MDTKKTLQVDLFGIKEEAEPVALSGEGERLPSQAGGPSPAAGAAPGSRARPKLWGVLLLVDFILVSVFGGAVAAKLYQHLYSPVSAAPAAPRRPAKTLPQPAPAAKAAEPPPAAPAKAPAPAPATANPKPAKPAPAAEPVKAREKPQPEANVKAAQPAAAPGDNRHSVPVEFKLKAPRARSVQLAGAFIVRGGRREMVHQDDGVWALTLYLLPGTNYRYWFWVNGKKRTLDPENSQVERGASVLVLP
ncbi:MAG: hypothetical protein NTY77_01500 [Elusimicrobia bacterium]|nr:hypothetical protein [Elusimicrobiota bacterium]